MAKPDASATRERIEDAAQSLILAQGFAATSIDQIIARVGLTKGAFFHHFKSKHELARALVERYAHSDVQILRTSLARAEKLSNDPLQQLLIFVGLVVELLEDADATTGCLFASFIYESGQFEQQVLSSLQQAILEWRLVIADKLQRAMQQHSVRVPVEVDSLADLFTSIIEGGYVMARTFGDRRMLADQTRHYRTYLELIFGLA